MKFYLNSYKDIHQMIDVQISNKRNAMKKSIKMDKKLRSNLKKKSSIFMIYNLNNKTHKQLFTLINS